RRAPRASPRTPAGAPARQALSKSPEGRLPLRSCRLSPVRLHLLTTQPGRVPQIHRELRPRPTPRQDERPALLRRLRERALLVQFVAPVYLLVRLVDPLQDVLPHVIDLLRLQAA